MRSTNGNTIIHSLNPAVKLLWLVSVCVTLYVCQSPVLPLILIAGVLPLFWLSGESPFRLPSVRFMTIAAVAILALQMFLFDDGANVVGTATDGLEFAFLTAGRLVAVLLLSILFVRTTDAAALAYALMRLGLPSRWGFALVTALRLAPLFRIEGQHVYRAQLLRGVGYDARSPRRIWLILRHLCRPMLISAIRSAQNRAMSMEGRGFGLFPTRTNLRNSSIGTGDVIALVLLAVLIAAEVV